VNSDKQIPRTDLWIAVLIFFATFAIWGIHLVWRRDLVCSSAFLYRDYGQYLLTTDALLHGRLLYRDVFWQYGPLPIYWYTLLARWLGNSPLTFVLAQAPLTGVALGMAYLLIRRYFSRLATLFAMLMTCFPWWLRDTRGGLIYYPMETAILTALALFWSHPLERTARKAFYYGLLLGLMQLIKFGGGAIAGLAIIMLDLFAIWNSGVSLEKLFLWITRSIWIAVGFVLVEGVLGACLLAVLPANSARNALWPSFMLRAYGTATLSDRWPGFETWGILTGTQLPEIVCLILGIWLLVFLRGNRQPRRSAPSTPELPVPYAPCLFTMFFIDGFFLYFKHKWLIYEYGSLLALPAGCALVLLAKRLRMGRSPLFLGICCLLLPCVTALPFKMLFQKPEGPAIRMPNGQTLWLSQPDGELVFKIKRVVDALPRRPGMPEASRPALLILDSDGSGLYYYGDFPCAIRDGFDAKRFLQPWEEEALLDSLKQTAALLVFLDRDTIAKLTADPSTWNAEAWSPFSSPERTKLLLGQISPPVVIDDRWVVFPLR